jgi:hypothetical protein
VHSIRDRFKGKCICISIYTASAVSVIQPTANMNCVDRLVMAASYQTRTDFLSHSFSIDNTGQQLLPLRFHGFRYYV